MVLDVGAPGDTDDYYLSNMCVLKDGGEYKMWYAANDNPTVRVHLATSGDGVSWTKQGVVVPLGTNPGFDGEHTHTPHVIKDGSNYTMWYAGHQTGTYRVLTAESTDGVTWTGTGTWT